MKVNARIKPTLAVGIGNFLFRYRNAIGPIGFVLALAVGGVIRSPGEAGPSLLVGIAGVLLAALGQALRIVTIGYEYIERGGRNRQVYASRLVQGGVFGVCRNPLYVGNILICVGVVLVAQSRAFYLVVLPFVLLGYVCIVQAEEAFLRGRFGAEYDDYCRRVNRWWPHWGSWRHATEGMRFNWRRVLVKEYNTLFLLLGALAGLVLWSAYRAMGVAALPSTPWVAVALAAWLALYGVVRALKKTGYVKA